MEIDSLRKLDELGRIALPIDFRRALHMKAGQTLCVIIKDDHLEMYPVEDKK